MIDLKKIRAVALDISKSGKSHKSQEAYSDFIWALLDRNYDLFLLSTQPDDDLVREDFDHSRLIFLNEEMPPSQATLKNHPILTSPDTLWVTDNPQLQAWVVEGEGAFAHLNASREGTRLSLRIKHLSELSALLDPTGFVMDALVNMVRDLRSFKSGKALVVGLGGPPSSGFQQLAVDFRTALQNRGFDLVDLLDLSSLLRSTDDILTGQGGIEGPWISPEAGNWIMEHVLHPLTEGRDVFIEEAPTFLPELFTAHFPLFLSRETVLLTFAELLFAPPVLNFFDVSVLLDVSPEETIRRLYEIPPGESFEPKFTEQYLSLEGRVYQDYLRDNNVLERASIRVDASIPHALQFAEESKTPLV